MNTLERSFFSGKKVEIKFIIIIYYVSSFLCYCPMSVISRTSVLELCRQLFEDDPDATEDEVDAELGVIRCHITLSSHLLKYIVLNLHISCDNWIPAFDISAGPVHFSDRRASSGQYILSFTGWYGPPSYICRAIRFQIVLARTMTNHSTVTPHYNALRYKCAFIYFYIVSYFILNYLRCLYVCTLYCILFFGNGGFNK